MVWPRNFDGDTRLDRPIVAVFASSTGSISSRLTLPPERGNPYDADPRDHHR